MPRAAALRDIVHTPSAALRHAGHSVMTKMRRDGRRRKKKDRSEAHDSGLDQLRFLVTTVGAIADGPFNVPLLKGVCALAEKVIDTVQVCSVSRTSHTT